MLTCVFQLASAIDEAEVPVEVDGLPEEYASGGPVEGDLSEDWESRGSLEASEVEVDKPEEDEETKRLMEETQRDREAYTGQSGRLKGEEVSSETKKWSDNITDWWRQFARKCCEGG